MSAKGNKSHRTEIIVALITLMGVLGGAVFYNWEHIFRPSEPTEPPDSEPTKEQEETEPDTEPLQPADLFVSEFGLIPRVPMQGESVTVRINVYNQGQSRAGPFTVQWFPDEDYPKLAHEWRLEGVPAGLGRILNYTYSGYPRRSARIGTKVVIDSRNEVEETDENNNVLTKTISVQKK